MILFTILGQPVAKGRPRFDTRTGRVYTPRKTELAEESLRANSRYHAPSRPFTGAVGLGLVFTMRMPKKPGRDVFEGAPHTPKPDIDNLVKLVKDAYKGLFWKDDSQVTTLTVTKVWGRVPSTRIQIEPIDYGLFKGRDDA